jgi:hypothetical protein
MDSCRTFFTERAMLIKRSKREKRKIASAQADLIVEERVTLRRRGRGEHAKGKIKDSAYVSRQEREEQHR